MIIKKKKFYGNNTYIFNIVKKNKITFNRLKFLFIPYWVTDDKFKGLFYSLLIITSFSEFVFVANWFVNNEVINKFLHSLT